MVLQSVSCYISFRYDLFSGIKFEDISKERSDFKSMLSNMLFYIMLHLSNDCGVISVKLGCFTGR